MFTIGDRSGLSARFTFPRTGAWQADLRIDNPDDVTGAVTINVEDGRLLLVGTVDRGGNWQDVDFLRVIGGTGGLAKAATPKHYSSASIGVVMSDLLRDAGEKLSATSDQGVLSTPLASWTTSALPTGQMIALLLKTSTLAANWRVLPNGALWVGVETWPESGLLEDDDYQVLSEDPTRMTANLGVEVPLLMPGTTLGGRNVSYVEHRLDSPETRTEVWFETDAPAADDRLRRAFGAMVRGANPSTAYAPILWATVVSQGGDTIDVQPVDVSRPTMAGVKLFAGLPQWTLQLAPGGHVLVGWGSGDPSQAFVVGFGADVVASAVGISCDAMKITAPTIGLEGASVTVGTEAVAMPTILSTPYLAAETVYLDVLATFLQAALDAIGSPSGAAAVAAAQAAFAAASPTYTSTQVRNS